MTVSDHDYQELQELEESLWVAKTRFDATYMERVLHEDFFEFGRSGRIYKRADTLDAAPREIGATIPLKDFAVHRVGEDVFLVTYKSEVRDEELEIGNRSSLWIKTKDGWKLRFHQGTVVN
jgi:hypothetical protein